MPPSGAVASRRAASLRPVNRSKFASLKLKSAARGMFIGRM